MTAADDGRRTARRLGPGHLPPRSPASGRDRSSTCSAGCAPTAPATVRRPGLRRGHDDRDAGRPLAGRAGHRGRLLPRDARRGGHVRRPGPGGVRPAATCATGRRTDRSTSSSATPSCTGCPGTRDLLARWAGLAARPAAGSPSRCRATSARRPTRCSPTCAARRGGPPGSADAAPRPDAVLEPAGYFDVLAAAGLAPDVWETTYLHVLTGADPVLAWVRSTVLRPVLARSWPTTTRPRSSPPSTPPRCGRPIPPGPTARRCCRSAGSSPSAPARLTTRPSGYGDPRSLTGLHHVQVACPAGSERRAARLLRRRARHDRGPEAAGPGRARRRLVPLRRRGDPLRGRGGLPAGAQGRTMRA